MLLRGNTNERNLLDERYQWTFNYPALWVLQANGGTYPTVIFDLSKTPAKISVQGQKTNEQNPTDLSFEISKTQMFMFPTGKVCKIGYNKDLDIFLPPLT